MTMEIVITESKEILNDSEQGIIAPWTNNGERVTNMMVPVARFSGRVSICKKGNGTPPTIKGKLERPDKGPPDISHTTAKPNKAILSYSKYLKYVGIPIIILLLVAIITTVLILFFPTVNPEHLDKTVVDPSEMDDDQGLLGPIGPGIIFEKKIWGGDPPLSSIPLRHPTKFVIIAHTITPFCTTTAACSARVLSIQQYHVGHLEYPDIGYNFLIGGDGNAYEGRGWDKKNFNTNDSISISFIGNYIYDNLTSKMIIVAQKLLKEGVKNGKLSEDYILICHKQIYATESPGPNVVDVVSKWPHFKPGSFMKTLT